MAAIKIDVASTIIISSIILAAALETRAAASSSSSCDDEVSKLTPCYSYIEGSGSSRPTSECCSQLWSTAATKPECLCQIILDTDNNLNKTRIMALPKACNVTTPPPTTCSQSSTLPSGYSTKISNYLQLSLIAVSYASIMIVI